MRFKKEICLFAFAIIFIALLFENFSAGVLIGNESHNISLIYGPLQKITGWVNISLENQLGNSELKAFNSSIPILDFLMKFSDDSNINFNCSPKDCKKGYSSILNSGENIKNFQMNSSEEKLIGLRLTGEIDDIIDLKFNVISISEESCLNPLKIDILDDSELNDLNIEWMANNFSQDLICAKTFGCYDPANWVAGQESQIIEFKNYCEKINLSSANSFRLGAEIIGSGDANFTMAITFNDDYKECYKALTGANNEITCDIEFDENFNSGGEAEICLIAEKLEDNANYKIKYEDETPCGYIDSYPHDFPIFVNQKKYSSIGNFEFNQELIDLGQTYIDLVEEINDYLIEKYNSNCTEECIIPIKIYSGTEQILNLSDLTFTYNKQGLPISESKFYEIDQSDVLINSDFQKLDLEKADLLTPEEIGNISLKLILGTRKLFEETIEIKSIPTIKNIIPSNFSVLIPTKFTAILENMNDSEFNESFGNLSYLWDFGDETTIKTTNINTIKHIYSEIKDYNLTLNISNKYGGVSKTIEVTPLPSKDTINNTLLDYKRDLKNFESDISLLEIWLQEKIKEFVNFNIILSELNRLTEEYAEGFIDDNKSIEIIGDLIKLKVPVNLSKMQSTEQIKFFPDEGQLDLNSLKSLGAGETNSSKKEIINAINNWIIENIDLLLESEKYQIYFKDLNNSENNYLNNSLISSIKLTLQPIQDLANLYLLFNIPEENLKFNQNFNVQNFSGGLAIIFSDLNQEKILQFLYLDNINFLLDFPIFLSPKLSNLDLGIIPSGICNNNNLCEKELGENYKNCRADCYPLLQTIFLLIGLFFMVFIVYILLQEWYKKHYESHLFHDKNRLFNVISFIDNSLKQGLIKQEIFNKLNKLKWNGEQISYAWKRFNGKRIGMWEIPIFRGLEKIKIKRELEKRRKFKSK